MRHLVTRPHQTHGPAAFGACGGWTRLDMEAGLLPEATLPRPGSRQKRQQTAPKISH